MSQVGPSSSELAPLDAEIGNTDANNSQPEETNFHPYVKVRVIDGLLENFECGWKLQGIYVTFVDSFKMKQDFLLASLEPKEECFEKPIIEEKIVVVEKIKEVIKEVGAIIQEEDKDCLSQRRFIEIWNRLFNLKGIQTEKCLTEE